MGLPSYKYSIVCACASVGVRACCVFHVLKTSGAARVPKARFARTLHSSLPCGWPRPSRLCRVLFACAPTLGLCFCRKNIQKQKEKRVVTDTGRGVIESDGGGGGPRRGEAPFRPFCTYFSSNCETT